MELLPSISDWISQNLPQDSPEDRNIPKASDQGFLPALFSTIDNIKGKVKRNVTDLFTDTDNALTKTADTINSDILSKDKLQDPGQWIAPGAGKLTGAFVSAFRPSNSKLLPSTLFRVKQDLDKISRITQQIDPLTDKLSERELSKYGTPEFLLDKYLPSTKAGGNPVWLNAEEVTLADFLKSAPINDLNTAAQSVAMAAKRSIENMPADGYTRNQNYLLGRVGATFDRGYSLEPDIRAFRDQITSGEPIYTVDGLHALGKSGDIKSALNTINSWVEQSSFTPEQLSKKSLNQLLGIAAKVEKEIQKTEGAIKDSTVARTAELNKAQGLAPGFVELKTKADFGAETHYLSHCVGAGGVDQATGAFLPKWHPITGEEIIRNKGLQNSGEIYYGLSSKGSAKYISYRPEGIPVATAEIDKYGNIKQLMGVRNTEITGELRTKIEEGLQPAIKEMKALGNTQFPLRELRLEDMNDEELMNFVNGL